MLAPAGVMAQLQEARGVGESSDDARPTSFDQPDAEAHEIETQALDRLARSAVMYLRFLKDPTADDYRAAALTLREVCSRRPDDVELQRMQIEAWFAAGDDAGVRGATRAVIRLDPSDTVAQLRMISDRISRLQSVEARQAAYDRLLSEGQDSLDASIRSRLAFDDALLARELGDDDRHIARLTLATQLDSTNKSAAVLASTYAMDHLSDPLARVEMLANVVLADPLDPATHFGLAEELIAHGAYSSALRFYRHAMTLRRLYGLPDSLELVRRTLLSNWAIEGSRTTLDMLAVGEESARFSIRQQHEAAKLAGEDPESIPPFAPSVLHEAIRFGAAIAIQDEFEIRAALDRQTSMTKEALKRLAKASEPSAQGEESDANQPPPDPEAIAASVRQWRIDLTWRRLLAGMYLEEAAEELELLAAEVGDDPAVNQFVSVYRGILAAQRGDRETADRLLTPPAAQNVQAQYGLGLAAERAGDSAGAMRNYAMLALSRPDLQLGIQARARVEQMLGQPLQPTPTVARLISYCAALPPEMDQFITEPRSLLHLGITHATDTPAPFDRLEVDVTLKNAGPIPLAIGDGAPIASNLLLAPRLTIGANQVLEQLKPEVVTLNRRIRLLPGQSMEMKIWASQGQIGVLNDQTILNSAILRWRAVTGFGVTTNGEYAPTAFSLSAETNAIRRPPIAIPAGGVRGIPAAIRTATGSAMLRALMAAPGGIQFFSTQATPELAAQFADEIAAAILDRLPTLTPVERIMFLTLFPNAGNVPAFDAITEALRQDTNRLVRLAFLFNRTTGPDDPMFTLAQAGGDPVVAEVASILHTHAEKIAREAETSDEAAPSK